MRTSNRLRAAAVVLAASGPALAQPSFHIMTGMPGGTGSAVVHAVSADGTTVVGSAGTLEPGTWRAFRWRLDTGAVENLGIIPSGLDGTCAARGVSADGSVVVGHGIAPTGTFHAFRWTAETGMVEIPDLPGGQQRPQAYGVSGDGTIVVGRATGVGQNPAFRWTAEMGMQSLGHLPGEPPGAEGSANAISTDGQTIVGRSYSNAGATDQAFRWTADEGMVGLGFAGPGSGLYSDATAVTPDGSVIVGETRRVFNNQLHIEAFRWTDKTGMQLLGSLPGDSQFSSATGLSADGSVVVGQGRSGWIWTEETGIVRIRDFLAGVGLDVSGYSLYRVDGISGDGLTIVGTANDPQGFPVAWAAVIPAPMATPLLASTCACAALRRRRVGLRSTGSAPQPARP